MNRRKLSKSLKTGNRTLKKAQLVFMGLLDQGIAGPFYTTVNIKYHGLKDKAAVRI